MKKNTTAPLPTKLNFWTKTKKFFKVEYLAVFASLIFLFTWYLEKVEIEKQKSELSDFYRYDTNTGLMLAALRTMEQELNTTIINQFNKKAFSSDSAFRESFIALIQGKIQQESEIIFELGIQKDGNNSVNQHEFEESLKNKELLKVLRSGDIQKIWNYDKKENIEFSKRITDLQNSLPSALNEIKKKNKKKLSLYLISYLFATILLGINKINKITISTGM